MNEIFTRYSLAEGVNLHVLTTEKFKTTSVSVHFHMPLAPETVTLNALLPMVMARASADYPTTAALSRHLDELYGAQFGIDIGRRGEVHTLAFRLEVPHERHIPGESGLLRRGLETLIGLILRPATAESGFKPDYFGQESTNLRQIIEGLINDKRRWAMVRCTEAMCQGEPFALYRLGRVQDLDSITAASLLEHHARMLSSAPVDLFIIGAVNAEEARDLVQTVLRLPASAPEGRRMPPTLVKRKPDRAVQEIEERLDVNQGVLVIGFRTGLTMLDREQYFPLLVANGILGGFPHSKLFQEVRERHSLAYFAYSSVETLKGVGFMYAGIEFDHAEQCRQIMLDQVRSLQNGDFDDDEFQMTISTMVNDILGAADSPGAMADLALDQVFSGQRLSIEDRVAAYRRVTRDEVTAAARQFTVDTVYFLNKAGGS